MTAAMTADDITAQAVQARLQAALKPTHLSVIDESAAHMGHAGSNGRGQGTHFRVRIAAPAFAARPRVACHRLVYDALQDFLDAGLHALAIEIVPTPSPAAADTDAVVSPSSSPVSSPATSASL